MFSYLRVVLLWSSIDKSSKLIFKNLRMIRSYLLTFTSFLVSRILSSCLFPFLSLICLSNLVSIEVGVNPVFLLIPLLKSSFGFSSIRSFYENLETISFSFSPSVSDIDISEIVSSSFLSSLLFVGLPSET